MIFIFASCTWKDTAGNMCLGPSKLVQRSVVNHIISTTSNHNFSITLWPSPFLPPASGNNAVEMQTTSTYDESTKEWIIDTPTTLAQKYWWVFLIFISTFGKKSTCTIFFSFFLILLIRFQFIVWVVCIAGHA